MLEVDENRDSLPRSIRLTPSVLVVKKTTSATFLKFVARDHGSNSLVPRHFGYCGQPQKKLVSQNSGLVALGRHVVTGRAK